MICKYCGNDNEENSLFCRECLESIDFEEYMEYCRDTFESLRKITLKFEEEEETPKNYFDFLKNLKNNITHNLREISDTKISKATAPAKTLTEEGLNLYLKAIETLTLIFDPEIEEKQGREIIIEGLLTAEEGNHKLNEALTIIEEEEEEEKKTSKK